MPASRLAPSPISSAVAEVLRTRRTSLGLTQKEVGALAGLGARYISLLECRRNQPTIATLCRLAKVLGLALSELVACAEDLIKRA